MVCTPAAPEKTYVAEPLESAIAVVAAAPSMEMATLPVGSTVLAAAVEATAMEMLSFAPAAGAVVAAASVVFEAISEDATAGQAFSK